MQVLTEQCRRLGLHIEQPVDLDKPPPLPPGSQVGRQLPGAKPGPSPDISSIHRRFVFPLQYNVKQQHGMLSRMTRLPC